MSEQVSLLPESPPEPSRFWARLGDMKMPRDTLPPSRQLLASVQAFGVLEPLKIVPCENPEYHQDTYEIVDGARRYQAAVAAGIEFVPVTLFARANEVTRSLIQLSSHALRSKNPVAEYDAIMALMGAGATEADIARETGMPVGTIRNRLKLSGLIDELERAFRKGDMPVSVAQEACRLPEAVQRKLAMTWLDKGRITATNVHEAREARRQAGMVTMSFDALVRQTPDDLGDTGQREVDIQLQKVEDALIRGDAALARQHLAGLKSLLRER